MNRRDFNQLAAAAVGSTLAGGLSGCRTLSGLVGGKGYYAGELPLLPQDDGKPGRRRNALDKARTEYRFNATTVAPVPLLDEVPEQEHFTARYLFGRAKNSADLLPNALNWRLRGAEPFDSLKSFETLFDVLPEPGSLRTWRTDESFAEQRLSGVNPMKLRRLRSGDALPFTLDEIPGHARTAAEATDHGRLFFTDYSDLAFVRGGRKPEKFLPTPRALFIWSTSPADGLGRLMPLAIHLREGGPVLTSANTDPTYWLIAKMCCQIADANHHEMSSHLGRTHFVLEQFAIATARQLAPNHPLGILLRPHFRFLMVNNELGVEKLINPGGIVDTLLAGIREDSLKVCTNAFSSWSIKEHAFPRELENRGLDDPSVLPRFAYRDDGRLLWDAIHEFVSAYLGLYYADGADLSADTELQAWCRELANGGGNGSGVNDMPSSISSRAELVELVTTLLFTCGPQHSAVNYPQYDYIGFTPNNPLAAYSPVPSPDDPDLEAKIMKFLPPGSRAEAQLQAMDALTNYHYDKLGDYEDGAFLDPKAQSVIADFQQQLHLADRTIQERNRQRLFPYEFLRPSQVLNSTSI